MSSSETYRAYLLRLWRAGSASDEWRASLDDPRTGERRCFATLERCCEYLIRVTGPDFVSDSGAKGAAADEAGDERE